MFQDLDSTLKQILDDAAMKAPPIVPPLNELDGATISFITPDKNFNPSTATVNLFLYDVKENRTLRDPTPIIEKIGSNFVSRQPPARVDCSYIVTAWSNATNEQKVVDEHRLLAQALLWLTRFPTIPAKYLQGTLVAQRYAPPMWVAQSDPNRNGGEFWDALAIPPRPAFYLTVTIAMELGLEDSGALVTTRFTGFELGDGSDTETLVQIGGRVLGPDFTLARVQTNLFSAGPTQASLNGGSTSDFKRGDVVLLEQGVKKELATIARTTPLALIFETSLTNTFTGGTIRIADLVPGRRSIRLTNITGIEAGATVRIKQGTKVEEHAVQSVGPDRKVITLAGALSNTYTMRTVDPPVKITVAVADAVVELTDVSLRTQSNSDGRYTFLRVPVGPRTVEVRAIGYQPKTQSLVVPGRPEDYEITLTPLP